MAKWLYVWLCVSGRQDQVRVRCMLDCVFQGDKIKSELAALVQGLPAVYEDVALSTQKLNPAVTFYHDFASFLMKT